MKNPVRRCTQPVPRTLVRRPARGLPSEMDTKGGEAVKAIRGIFASLLLLSSTAPARADFKYTDTTQITGGALLGMAKFASMLSKDARKQEQEALQPTTTTHYIKGERLR